MAKLQTGDNLRKLSRGERLGQDRNSEYLGAEDIDPGIEPVLTIEALWSGMVTLQKGKENKDVITFVEKSVSGIKNVRPLIVNATNRKTLRKLFGGVEPERLVSKKIQLYIDHKVRNPEDGTLTDGIRIKPKVPVVSIDIKCTKCKGIVTAANNLSAEQLAKYTEKKYGAIMCAECATKAAQDKPVEPKQAEEGAKE